MNGRVDMSAGMIGHTERHRFRGEHRVTGDLFLGMITPDGHDDRRVRRVHLCPVKQVAAEVDQFHIILLFAMRPGFWCDGIPQ